MRPYTYSIEESIKNLEREIEGFKHVAPLIFDAVWPEDTIYHVVVLPSEVIISLRSKQTKDLRSAALKFVGKLNRHFMSDKGEFQYRGVFTYKGKDINLVLEDMNDLFPECKIIPYKVERTVYKSVCNEPVAE